ncbi:MAG: DUF6320 domain-containing protein [Christensenellales bacterium]|jgi:hypothetical protein
MSYCVHCGVKLSESERTCPLCKIPVQDPVTPWKEPRRRPYPKSLEIIEQKVARRYFAAMASIVLLIPVLITVLCNYIFSASFSWSLYVIGATAVAYVYALVPFLFSKPRPILCLSLDTLASLAFLYAVSAFTRGNWFWPMAFPVVIIAGVLIISLTWYFRRRKGGKLKKAAALLLAIGAFAVCLQIFVYLFLEKTPLLSWSLFILIPCGLLAAALLVLNKKYEFKDEVNRRFFI